MPTYEYYCEQCNLAEEIVHSIHEDPIIKCSECEDRIERIPSMGMYIINKGIKESLENHREQEHTKKVKDPERAVKMRKKAFGHDAVGDPSMVTDPIHIVKRGRTIGGQQKEIDKSEFIRAAAKDDHIVNIAKKVIQKNK